MVVSVTVTLNDAYSYTNIFATTFSVAASTMAMISTQAVIVLVAGGICCLNAPAVVYKHFLISKSPSEFILVHFELKVKFDV